MAVERDFDSLFRSQFDRLVAFGLAMSGSVDVARDLAQETMARAHRNWGTVVSADSPEAWVRRVMANLLIDHDRRRRVEGAALTRLARLVPEPDDTAPGPAASRMAEMLALLPQRQRTVVALYYVDDLPIGDIAAALKIAPGTVKALLWKARRSLQRQLSGEGDLP